MLSAIVELYNEVDGIFGYRQMTLHLTPILGKKYNYKRIYRLMKLINIQSVIRKKKRRYKYCAPQVVAENVLNREFTAKVPNQKWLTDVTEFKLTTGKKLYLSAILDLHDRSIVSYEIGDSNNNQLVFKTLDQAIAKNPDASPLFHSDRGFQYTNKKFKLKLDKINATQSMSRVGRCIDNGPMEGFFGIIKSEMFYLRKFNSREELIAAIEKYMNFYNLKRRQKKLKGLTPNEYRSQSFVA